ncbi:MAG: hypothetical protein AAF990_07125 [Bacteroidota bacterium]
MNKALLTLSFCLFLISSSFAQLSKTLHQNFPLEGFAELQVDVFGGQYEVEKWAGNTILTETVIEIFDASPAIFKHFLEAGRYELEGLADEKSFKLTSKDMQRKPIRSKNGECYEFVKIRLYIPEDFESAGENTYSRPIEEEATADGGQ